MKLFQILVLLTLSLNCISAGIDKKVRKLFPNCEIEVLETKDHFTQCLEVTIDQKLDHFVNGSGTFKQRIFIFHTDEKAPVHLETEGYWANPYTREMAKVMQGNQVLVEYRFYGESAPTPIPWQYLTNDQAIEDLHRIVTTLKNIYKGPWLCSGISKGGETTIIYKHHYPNDCDVHMPYVAPIILDREDPRTEVHIKTTGSDSCRSALYQFQRRCLQQRDSMLVYLKDWAGVKGHSFNLAGHSKALEYAVLEFTFSFWQWGGRCQDIPGPGASTRENFKYVNSIVGFDFYSDRTFKRLYPSYYQHELELGYYGFPTGHLDDLLQDVKDPDNMFFAPPGTDIKYNSEYMQPVLEYVEGHGDRMIYIYGELDTWSACAVNPSPLTDHLKLVLEGGSHATRLKDFSKEDQEKVYAKLREWLGIEIQPLPSR